MTNAAKKKAGIKVKPLPKRVTINDKLRWIEAKIAVMENPDKEMPSKEPLVCIPLFYL